MRAPHVLHVHAARSVGGAERKFLLGLARREIWGSRVGQAVVVPPVDSDPVAGSRVDEFVRVADEGVVLSWTWVPTPRPSHPVATPFAFALIRLDGADTGMFHVVDVPDEAAMTTGMRVRADWRQHRSGSVLDIRAFVPVGVPVDNRDDDDEVAEVSVVTDVRLDYAFEPGVLLSQFFRSLAERRIEGGRCAACDAVYVPPRVRCPVCGTGPMTAVTVADTGTVSSYVVVHLPPPGMALDVPYAWARVRLDGADVPIAHLLGDIPIEDIRVGQRVEAVWLPDDELVPSWESIVHFRPVPR